MLQVELERNRRNRFRLRAFDDAGAPVRLATGGFAIVHGISIADPPLARTIGVACADDVDAGLLRQGDAAARAPDLRPPHDEGGVGAAAATTRSRIPVVQGESLRAHRNRLVGLLSIAGVDAGSARRVAGRGDAAPRSLRAAAHPRRRPRSSGRRSRRWRTSSSRPRRWRPPSASSPRPRRGPTISSGARSSPAPPPRCRRSAGAPGCWRRPRGAWRRRAAGTPTPG